MESLLAGRYELGPVVSHGSGVSVHHGRDTILDRPVAVRLLQPDAPAEVVRREGENIRLLAALHHPALVCLRNGPGDDADLRYTVTDPVDGRTLSDRLAGGPVPAAELRGWAVELADALAHLHAAGIPHGALDPSDVLLVGGRVRLAGFGPVRLPDRDDAEPGAFAAPEQRRGGPPSAGADIHALGAVLAAALGGAPAGPLVGVLDAMRAPDPADRPTAVEACAALAAADLPPESVRPTETSAPVPITRVPHGAPTSRSRSVWARATGGLSAAVLVVAALFVVALSTASAMFVLDPTAHGGSAVAVPRMSSGPGAAAPRSAQAVPWPERTAVPLPPFRPPTTPFPSSTPAPSSTAAFPPTSPPARSGGELQVASVGPAGSGRPSVRPAPSPSAATRVVLNGKAQRVTERAERDTERANRKLIRERTRPR